MNEKKTQKLLRDLVGLYLKYSRKDFEHALKLLQSARPKQEERPPKRKAIRPTRASPKSKLKDQPERDEKHAVKLSRFLNDVSSERLLKNPDQLNEYAKLLNLEFSSESKRADIVRKLGERLSERSLSDQIVLMKAARSVPTEKSSLQAWTALIVKDK